MLTTLTNLSQNTKNRGKSFGLLPNNSGFLYGAIPFPAFYLSIHVTSTSLSCSEIKHADDITAYHSESTDEAMYNLYLIVQNITIYPG